MLVFIALHLLELIGQRSEADAIGLRREQQQLDDDAL
jgi:hypothetical protein